MSKTIGPWGKMCKTQMINQSITLKELAAQAGLSTTYVSAIINGRIIVPEETINKINKVLNIAPTHNKSIAEQAVK